MQVFGGGPIAKAGETVSQCTGAYAMPIVAAGLAQLSCLFVDLRNTGRNVEKERTVRDGLAGGSNQSRPAALCAMLLGRASF